MAAAVSTTTLSSQETGGGKGLSPTFLRAVTALDGASTDLQEHPVNRPHHRSLIPHPIGDRPEPQPVLPRNRRRSLKAPSGVAGLLRASRPPLAPQI